MENNNSITFRFLQISDLRLGSTSSLSLHLSPAQRQQRLEESLESLQKAIALAKEKSLDAVLIPGNLYDHENVTAKTIGTVQKIFASLDPIPVYITPATTDALSRDSMYLTNVLNARGLEDWSQNVHIFKGPGLQTIALPDKPNVRISGLATQIEDRGSSQETPIPALEEHDRSALNILLYPMPAKYQGMVISDEEFSEAISQPDFSYTAVSGPLNQCRARGEEGRVVAAASGTFTAHSADETGARIAFSAELSRKLPGRLELDLEPIELDQRRIINLKLDLSTIAPSDWKKELETSLVSCGVRQEDILLFEVSGTYPAGAQQDLIQQVRNKSYFHIRCSDKSRPDYLATLSSANKIEQGLIEHMNSLFAEASRAADEGEKTGDDQLAIIDDALYFGLEALREGRITLRDAD
ncbi:MAG: hypothetical protein K2X77_01560 [Candidatus Obscuribacterales bacterium]|jgi:hypothetical protein|nr:hypothetical protein [Candidatus Obscuribacterales bacterium]